MMAPSTSPFLRDAKIFHEVGFAGRPPFHERDFELRSAARELGHQP